MSEKKVQNIRPSKFSLIVIAMLLMLGLVGSAMAASQPEVLAHQPEGLAHTVHEASGHDHSETLFSGGGASPNMIIMHYNENGNPTGLLHSLSIDAYYAILDALLASGHDPSPQNIDCMAHRMRGGNCPLW